MSLRITITIKCPIKAKLAAGKCGKIKYCIILGAVSISRRELFEVWRQQNDLKDKNQSVFLYVFGKLGLDIDSKDNFYTVFIEWFKIKY